MKKLEADNHREQLYHSVVVAVAELTVTAINEMPHARRDLIARATQQGGEILVTIGMTSRPYIVASLMLTPSADPIHLFSISPADNSERPPTEVSH